MQLQLLAADPAWRMTEAELAARPAQAFYAKQAVASGLSFLHTPEPASNRDFQIALWIKVLCALTMAAGTAVGGWRNIAIILGLLTFLLAIAWAFLVKERILGERSVPTLSTVMKGFGLVLRSRTVWMLSIAAFLLFGHSNAWSSHFPGFFEVKYGMTSAMAGQIVSITLFSGVFAGVFGPTLSDRIGSRKPAILIACVAGGLCNMLQGSFLGPVLTIILLIMPFGVGTIAPLLLTIPFELKELDRSVAGAAIGMILTFQNLGTFIYPILSGWLIDLFTPNYYPYFGAQMMAFALTFILVWRLVPETGQGPAKAAPRLAPIRSGVA